MNKKVVIVTGASRGIGAAISKVLANLNYVVVGTFVSSNETAVALKNEIEELGGTYIPVRADVRVSSDCENVVAEALNYGQVYGLVNNAGITNDNLLLRMTEENWRSVIDTNLTGAFLMTKAAAKEMIKNREGSIVNISSVVGLYGNAGQVNYSASKAGLIGFTKSLAKELGQRNVRVNAVAPGFIETDMTSKLSDELKEKAVQSIYLKRFGRAEEVAEVVAFLISEKSSYINGEIIEVSGGIAL
ncbi:MAG: 3-oxoacyl-[acyl-carrier-protein] reductase [Actinobacteria bacterium]|nr:3-oxoacyl-[acyl-carrier-protein] reductase [Actinomycetota bacterium]